MSTDWFSQLPPINAKRLAVKVTPDALRQIRGGSPWVYDGSIVSASHEGAAGDLAVVFDNDRKFAAIGLWDPSSPIRLKVLHKGNPQTIDDDVVAPPHRQRARPSVGLGCRPRHHWVPGDPR